MKDILNQAISLATRMEALQELIHEERNGQIYSSKLSQVTEQYNDIMDRICALHICNNEPTSLQEEIDRLKTATKGDIKLVVIDENNNATELTQLCGRTNAIIRSYIMAAQKELDEETESSQY